MGEVCAGGAVAVPIVMMFRLLIGQDYGGDLVTKDYRRRSRCMLCRIYC